MIKTKDDDLIDALNQLAAATPEQLLSAFNTVETQDRAMQVSWKLFRKYKEEKCSQPQQ